MTPRLMFSFFLDSQVSEQVRTPERPYLVGDEVYITRYVGDGGKAVGLIPAVICNNSVLRRSFLYPYYACTAFSSSVLVRPEWIVPRTITILESPDTWSELQRVS